jgi:hypothetical protein
MKIVDKQLIKDEHYTYIRLTFKPSLFERLLGMRKYDKKYIVKDCGEFSGYTFFRDADTNETVLASMHSLLKNFYLSKKYEHLTK